MTAIFAAAIFLSSALLFWLEPLYGKMVLPLLGGAPPVWNACMLFYQVALLAGYAWAHASSRLGARRHMLAHLVLGVVALAVLPFAVPGRMMPPPPDHPLRWILGVLSVGVGLPFVLVAANGPLLQHAFTQASGRARDPYFLYAASNLGSAIALLSYPLVFERYLSLRDQGVAWKYSYVALLLAMGICAVLAYRRSPGEPARVSEPGPPIAWRRKLRWTALAAIPSSLMLGVTTYISAEIAPVPLIWIVPLAIYLATLVVAFAATERLSRATRTIFSGAISGRTLATSALVLLLAVGLGAVIWLRWGMRPAVITAHLLLFTLAALTCHVSLAADRPPPGRLTEYYLWLAAGGGVGGVFNTLLGPLLFTSVLEYPLALAAVVMVLPSRADENSRRSGLSRGDLLWPVAIGALAALLPAVLHALHVELPFSPRLLLAAPALAALAFSGRPVRFGGTLVAVIAASAAYPSEIGSIEYATRNFYSVHRVLRDDRHGFRWLTNGVTVHGGQRLGDTLAPLPLTYYSPSGPAGDAFRAVGRPGQRVGVIGLGAGALMYYAAPSQQWTFFEIDPAVTAIARDPRYFTFLRDARAPYRVLEGDARLSLERDSTRYHILVLDAFSSDAVPVHLLTREAMRLYVSRLEPGGVLLMHISNRFYDLGPLVGVMGRDAGLGAMQRHDLDPDDMETTGKFGSHWVVLARAAADVGSLLRAPGWQPLAPAAVRVWTDDYSSVLPLLRSRAQ